MWATGTPARSWRTGPSSASSEAARGFRGPRRRRWKEANVNYPSSEVYWLSTLAMSQVLASTLTIRVEGQHHVPRRGSAMMVGNHPCAIDNWICYTSFPRRCFSFIKAEDYHYPPFHAFWKQFGSLPVTRRGDNSQSFKQAEEWMRQGYLMALFPESRVTEGADVLPFSSSFLTLAHAVGVPIIPFAIAGSEAALADPIHPRQPWDWKLRPAEVMLTIGEPLHLEDPAGDRKRFRAQRDYVRQVVADLAGDLRDRLAARRPSEDQARSEPESQPEALIRIPKASPHVGVPLGRC